MRNAGDDKYRLTSDNAAMTTGKMSMVESPINFADGNSQRQMRRTSHEGLRTDLRSGSSNAMRVASEEFLPKDYHIRKVNPTVTAGSVSDYKELLRKTIREHD